MSEFAPQPHPNEALRIHDKELAHLGALVMEAAMRDDLGAAVEKHVQNTGVENPNVHGKGLFIGKGEVPMSNENVYRSVTEPAVEDLGASGVVRGARTAGMTQVNTSGHTTYWNNGETGKNTPLGQGMIIEAPRAEAETGWVTADKVTGIYAKDADGRVKNILPSQDQKVTQ